MIPPHFFTMTLPRSTKGNDGRGAARRRRLRQQLTAIVSCVFTLVLMALFWEPDEATGAAGRHLSSSLRNRLDSIRSRVARQGGLKKAGQGGLGKEDNNNNKLSTNNRLNDILTGKLQLVDVQVRSNARVQKDGSYEGVHGEFCHVDWASHKKDPSTTPMFRDVVAGSPDCEDDRVSMDLQEVMEAVSQFDQGEGVDNPNGQIHLLDLGGFVFHESRCGSTLVANVLQAMYPEKHRVYSESAPPLGLVRAFERAGLPDEHASTVLKDVIYLMGRSNDPKETHVFFKIQSIGATRMKVFLEAFPDTPFMFVYRDPVQVMVSQFSHGVNAANCVNQQRRPSHLVRSIVQARNIQVRAEELDPEDLCAAHLAGITETAVWALTEGPNPNGSAVNYRDLPHRLWEDILPNAWDLKVSPEAVERMQTVSGVYSKGRGQSAHQEFEGDSKAKDATASDATREAANVFLYESYQRLEQMAQG